MARGASNLTLQERALLNDPRVLSLTDEFDLFTASQARSRLEELTEERPSVIVDVSAVTLMDSSGLSVLLDAWHDFGAKQRVFRVVCPPGPVRTTLEITGLDEARPLATTREEALSLLAARRGIPHCPPFPCPRGHRKRPLPDLAGRSSGMECIE